MTTEQEQQIRDAVAQIHAAGYRDGWHDAMTELRKAALHTRYNCPVMEHPSQGYIWLNRTE